MSLRRVLAIVLRQLFLIRSSPSRVVPLFIWVAVDIVLWGFLTQYLNRVSHAGFDFVPAMLGAVLLWDFFIRIMQGVTMAFFEDVWARNFLNIFSTPIRIGEYLAGLVLSSVATSAVGIVVMFVLAVALFGFSFLSYGVILIPALLILFLCGIALGICASALVMRWGPSAEWFIWPLPAIISPFAGVLYPVSLLPDWMQAVSRVLPPAYLFESLRAVVSHAPVRWPDLGIAAALAILYLGLSAGLFRATFRHAMRTGLIARYSAETLS